MWFRISKIGPDLQLQLQLISMRKKIFLQIDRVYDGCKWWWWVWNVGELLLVPGWRQAASRPWAGMPSTTITNQCCNEIKIQIQIQIQIQTQKQIQIQTQMQIQIHQGSLALLEHVRPRSSSLYKFKYDYKYKYKHRFKYDYKYCEKLRKKSGDHVWENQWEVKWSGFFWQSGGVKLHVLVEYKYKHKCIYKYKYINWALLDHHHHPLSEFSE